MRKIILLSFAVTCLNTVLQAQTNTFPDNGNAGLGTLAPSSWFSDKVLQIEGTRPTLRLAPLTDGALGTILFKGKFSDGINGSADEFHFNYYSNSSNPSIVLGAYKNVASPIISFLGSGNVGIGTAEPDQKLTVKGGIGFEHTSADKKLYSPNDGVLEWMTHDYASQHGFAISHQGQQRFFLNTMGNSFLNGGNVGIGTTTPAEKLSVNGNIRAKEIKVETTNWPDYVFNQDYKILGLQELDAYIKANKHLPEMPSAADVEVNGIELGELVKLQQKKIEELTLHLIEKDKAMNALFQRVEALEHK